MGWHYSASIGSVTSLSLCNPTDGYFGALHTSTYEPTEIQGHRQVSHFLISKQVNSENFNIIQSNQWSYPVINRLCLITFTLFTFVATIAVLLSAPHIIVTWIATLHSIFHSPNQSRYLDPHVTPNHHTKTQRNRTTHNFSDLFTETKKLRHIPIIAQHILSLRPLITKEPNWILFVQL